MNRDTAVPSVEEFPGTRAATAVDLHDDVAAPSVEVYDFVWDYTEEAIGPFCTDVDGNVFLDFTSHIGAAPLGYNNPKVLDRLEEFDLVDPMKIAGQDFYFAAGDPTDPRFPGATELMDRLVSRTSHYDLDTVFLSNSGSEAIENAIKIAYDHAERPKYGITFDGAFHGRTIGSLSVTRADARFTRGYPQIPGILELPYCSNRRCDRNACECGFFTGDGSRLRTLFDEEAGHVDPAEVAFLVLEPVQGVGGYNVPSEEFMAEVQAVCETNDVLLVSDEIQTGIGRTGELWASDHYPIEPDVVAAAKALRVGATVANAEVFPDETGRLGSTWGGGDVLAAAVGSHTLDVIDEYDLLENATETGRLARELLVDFDHPTVVDVRGKGLLLAVEFDSGEFRDAVVDAAVQRGLLVLGCGPASLRMLPPLDVTEREIRLGVDRLRAAILDVANGRSGSGRGG